MQITKRQFAGAELTEGLPAGWERVASRSRPGEFSFKNLYTGDRQSWEPTEPAYPRGGGGLTSPDSVNSLQEETKAELPLNEEAKTEQPPVVDEVDEEQAAQDRLDRSRERAVIMAFGGADLESGALPPENTLDKMRRPSLIQRAATVKNMVNGFGVRRFTRARGVDAAKVPARIDHALEGFEYDFVLVFKHPKGHKVMMKEVSEILDKIMATGLEIVSELSSGGDKVVAMIRAPLFLLRAFAEHIQYKLELEPAEVEAQCRRGWTEYDMLHKQGAPIDPINEPSLRRKYIVRPFSINEDERFSKLSPYEYHFGAYDQSEELQPLYRCPPGLSHPFGNVTRIKLILLLLELDGEMGAQLEPLRSMKADPDCALLAYFPLHDHEPQTALEKQMMQAPPQEFPVNQIKDYYGEKMALYFAWTAFLTTRLAWLSTVALVFGVYVIYHYVVWGTLLNLGSVLYSIIVAAWANAMLEAWKREECTLALKWGMTEFEDTEVERPEFEGEEIVSYIDGSEVKFFPPEKKRGKRIIAESTMALVMCLVLTAVMTVVGFKIWLTQTPWGRAYGPFIASAVNSILVEVFSKVVAFEVAQKLANFENHRTDTEFEDSLILKIFLFEVSSSYSQLYYIAFPAQSTSNICTNADDCSIKLLISLAGVMFAKCFGQNVGEIAMPFLQRHFNHAEHEAMGHGDEHMDDAELEFMMSSYDPINDTIQDYCEIAIIYGFVILFTTIFPIGPGLAYLGFKLELRIDAYKISHQQRMIPRGAQDIGHWMSVFKGFVAASIVTNAAMICFRFAILPERNLLLRTWIFNISLYVLFSVMLGLDVLIPDVPTEVEIQKKRSEHILDKVLHKIPDPEEISSTTPRSGGSGGGPPSMVPHLGTPANPVTTLADSAAAEERAVTRVQARIRGWAARVQARVRVKNGAPVSYEDERFEMEILPGCMGEAPVAVDEAADAAVTSFENFAAGGGLFCGVNSEQGQQKDPIDMVLF